MKREAADMHEDIDFVITWVDSTDPAWQKSKALWLAKENRGAAADATQASRWRSWDTLKYWFRGVEKYAPWVHGVYFVTCGQVPAWLNPDAPKLHIIDHRDFIPDKYLPTFSSHPIELNFHRIPGLSERFVLFCDDFFLTDQVSETDFFDNGLPCDCIEEQPVSFRKPGVYNDIRVNDIVFANRHFNKAQCRHEHKDKWFSRKTPHASFKNYLLSRLHEPYVFGFHIPHTPQPFLKSTFEACWAADPALLDVTCSHRFRDPSDISQTAFRYWQLLEGNFTPYDRKKTEHSFRIGSELDALCDAIVNRRYKMICANDDDVTDFAYDQQRLTEAFEKVLPETSTFEKVQV